MATVTDQAKQESLIAKFEERMSAETSAVFASSRGWDDGVILPQDTRQVQQHTKTQFLLYRHWLREAKASFLVLWDVFHRIADVDLFMHEAVLFDKVFVKG